VFRPRLARCPTARAATSKLHSMRSADGQHGHLTSLAGCLRQCRASVLWRCWVRAGG
jgi:hypothetical protein